jgi:hypothetical protein
MSKTLFNLQKLMEGQNPYEALLEQTRGLVKKWEPTGLLDGMNEEHEIYGMAILLENQARQLLDEVSQTGGAGAEQWSGVALPLVRRIFGEVAAKEFVSIQPMNLPSGLVFYIDFKYGSGTQPGFTQNQSVFGGSGAGKTPGTTDIAEGGLYGAGGFGYSINDQSAGGTSATGSSASGNTFASASAAWGDINFEFGHVSASLSAGRLLKVFWNTGSMTNPDLEGVRAFELTGGGISQSLQEFTNVQGANLVWIVSGSSAKALWDNMGMAATNYTVKYHRQPTADTRGDFEDTSESGSAVNLDIPEIDISVAQEPIVAKTRKLKAVWTPELAQDLNAYHSIDAEAELTALLSEYIGMEIDLEILDMLITNAITTEYWNALPGYEVNNARSAFYDASSHTGTKNEWYQTLGNKIQKVSNKIHQLTLRGGANFIVVSPDVATVIESIPGYAADTDGNQQSFAMGVQKVGMLNSRFTVYKNPYLTQNILLVGFRGSNFLETGAVYSPYIPLIMTPLIYDPNNFTPRRGVMTRYAKKIVRPEFYGKIYVAELDKV